MTQSNESGIGQYPQSASEPLSSKVLQLPLKKLHVIVNPAAGQDKPILGAMNTAFQEAGIDWEMFLTKQAGDGYRFAQNALASNVDGVAVYGGDGTVMEVANALNGSSVPMAIFPGGTANVMSVELGIPGELAAALALVCTDAGTIRTVDMGRVRDQLFLLRLGIGYWAEVTKNAPREAKNQIGNLAYILSAIQQMGKTQSAIYRFRLDGMEVEAEGIACMIANSGNIGLPGLKLSQSIDVGDGLLDVVVIRAVDVGVLLSVAANAIGIADNLPHWQARQIELVSEPPQAIECDGEIIEETPVSVSVVPHSLNVIVPKLDSP